MSRFNLLLPIAIAALTSMHTSVAAATPVNVVKAKITPLAPIAWVSGTVVSRNNSQIAFDISGRVIKITELGSKVVKGDIIAKIDDTVFQIQKAEAQANVLSAQSKLDFLESEVSRKQALVKQNLSAKTDLEKTTSDRNVAKADLMAAQSKLARVEQNIEYSRLKAPFSGLVAQRLSNQGEYIDSGTAIIRLVQTDNLEASLFAPLTAYRFLNQTNVLAIESPLGKSTAPIKSVIPVSDSRSHLMEVRLDMSAIDWPVGLNIKAAVANGESKEVLAVPRDALVLRRDGTSVFKIDSNNIAKKINVTIGIAVEGLVEIIGQVKDGDLIVIRGAERLRDGQTVEVKENNDALVSHN
ncbi:efflux RND transporter periplasmic adaptor subunit [Colwelliaceae bacterium 6471]